MSLRHDLQEGERPELRTPHLSPLACAPLPPPRGEAWGACGPLTPALPCPQEFAPSDDELESYRRGEEWDPQKAEEKRKLKVSSPGGSGAPRPGTPSLGR